MKSIKMVLGPATLALLATGYLAIPTAVKAADSDEITNLLADAKAHAVELNADAASMESFTRSKASWQSYANHLTMIKEHVNDVGKLLTKLKNAEAAGSPWQQTAIKRIEPLLKEMADNTTATIKHLNENQNKVHFPAFQDFVKENYELSTNLANLIRDFVDYGNARDKFESLGSKLEVPEHR
jgi:hypothetical protein